ncbi:RtcB family protein [Fervidicoccus sp.]|uniref:RtcB family protein n=1 Tax=Fervidicoccus sp. TaxID=2060324 RepID=UPI003D0CE4C0
MIRLPVKVRKINEYEWVIDKGEKTCMKVPAVIFADEFLLSKMQEDLTLEQAANVACLNGIVDASYVMPDGHQGYGFPIGGVAGMDIEENGVISPGGVGYDINCLTPDMKVLDSYGAWRYIKELKIGDKVLVNNGRSRDAEVVFWFYRKEEKIYIIKTKTGRIIKASHDHPILTDRGMILAKDLQKGMRIATYPFSGVRYEAPAKKLLLDRKDLEENIAKELEKRGLLPLYTDNPKLPLIIKLLGYFTGDGTFDGKKTWFYGSEEGLEEIRKDIELLGYKPSNIKTRRRASEYNGRTIKGKENSVYVSAKSFRKLLEKLGAPIGKKTHVPFTVPSWIKELPLWMKRLYLAAYFGAEMNKPQTINGYKFEHPFVSVNKLKELEKNAEEFLKDIASMLEEFGIKTLGMSREDLGDKVRIKLLVSTKPKFLIRLWTRVGYIYNPRRQRLAIAAASWLRLKINVLKEKASVAEKAASMHVKGQSAGALFIMLSQESKWINKKYVERAIYDGITVPRVSYNFPRFEDWIKDNLQGDIVYDMIEDIKIKTYDGYVYDITVNDDAHNFVANGIIVSNCGVRLLRTELDEKDVRSKIKELVDTIARNVPSGLGSEGKIKVTPTILDEVLNRGVEWAVEHGFGRSEDPEHIEERGSWSIADSSKVSSRAKSRGAPELGSLGSGNHFLEVQVVEKIFDRKIAEFLGITHEGQVTVMIHTGSRGLGHQVASDYLQIMEKVMRKYGTVPPDRELASIPFNSPEAQDYVKAMAAAANYAWTNRQLITHWVRESFKEVFKTDDDKLGLEIIYDVAHNIAKIEEHEVNGKRKRLVVHRKGATRAFPPGHPDIPKDHKNIGQVVLIPGSMGTASYVLVGTNEGKRTWFTAPHGAGRWMSRSRALKNYTADQLISELSKKGIYVKAASKGVLIEEAPSAYKDVDRVALVADKVGIGKLVLKLRPIGVTKG